MAGENQLELGRLGLTLFLEILDVANGTRDNEITQYTLETLQELIEPPTLNKTPNNHPSLVNSDFLLSNPHNIEILLDLLVSVLLFFVLFFPLFLFFSIHSIESY